MGQAKRRGTFDDRMTQAMLRNEKLLEELIKTKPAPIHVAAKKLGIQRLALNLDLHWNKVKNLCQP